MSKQHPNDDAGAKGSDTERDPPSGSDSGGDGEPIDGSSNMRIVDCSFKGRDMRYRRKLLVLGALSQLQNGYKLGMKGHNQEWLGPVVLSISWVT